MELTKNQEELDMQLGFIFRMSLACDLDLIKYAKKHYYNEMKRYEAIGIMDGNPTYYEKLADKEAYFKRIDAFHNFVKTMHETDKDIIR